MARPRARQGREARFAPGKTAAVTLCRVPLFMVAFVNLHLLVLAGLWIGGHLANLDVALLDFQLSAGNPLYLTLMALLFEQGKAPDRNHTRLYEQVFDLLLEGKHRFPEAPIDRPAAVRQALRHLAFSMTVDNLDALPRNGSRRGSISLT